MEEGQSGAPINQINQGEVMTRIEKLGKLSLTILENFVGKTLGENFIQELKSGYDQYETLIKALSRTENRFIEEYTNKDLSTALFIDLSQKDRPTLQSAIKEFYNHPTDQSLPKAIETILLGDLKNITKTEAENAIRTYISILKEELAILDPQFRENIRVLADLSGEKSQKEMVDILRRVEHLITKENTYTDTNSPLPESIKSTQKPISKVITRNDKTFGYLLSIIRDDEQLEQRYISLSAQIIHKVGTRPENWPVNLIPTAFQVIDENFEIFKNEDQELNSIEDCLAQFPRFVLIGEPGSGKTTTILKFRLDLAKKAINNDDERIPLIIRLSEWPDSIKEFTEFVDHEIKIQGLSAMHYGELFLLLDGLNEMNEISYENNFNSLENWLKKNHNIPVIVTCRERSYLHRRKLSIPSIMARPLDEIRIRKFLYAYLGESEGNKLYESLSINTKKNKSPRDLIRLASNPYLLAIITYIYSRNGSLPQNRGQLFQLFIKTLMAREEKNLTTKGITSQQLMVALRKLGYAMQEKQTSTTMPTAWAKKQIPQGLDFNTILFLGIQSSILKTSKDDQMVNFSHQLILEYFAAEELLSCPTETWNKALTPVQYFRDERLQGSWDEVFFMLAGITITEDFVDKLSSIDPVLTFDCLAFTSTNIWENSELPAKLFKKTISLIESRNSNIRNAAIDKIVALGNVPLEYLLPLLNDKNSKIIRRTTIRIIRELKPDKNEALLNELNKCLNDKNSWVRKDAKEALQELYPETYAPFFEDYQSMQLEPKTEDANRKDLLLEMMQELKHKPTKVLAKNSPKKNKNQPQISNLHSGTKKHQQPSSSSLPTTRIKRNQYTDEVVNKSIDRHSSTILNNLSLNKPPSIESIITNKDSSNYHLIFSALESQNLENKISAINAVGRLQIIEAHSQLILLAEDSNPKIRKAIAASLGEFKQKDNADTLANLVNDTDINVQIFAAKSLIQLGKLNGYDVLKKAMETDDPKVQIQVIVALRYIGNKQAVKYIKSAYSNSNNEVRREAIHSLGVIKDIDSLDFLIEALKDTSRQVRSRAAEALGKIASPIAVDPLLDLLRNSTPAQGSQAAQALGKIGDARALKPLQDIYPTKNRNIQKYIYRAIIELESTR